MFEILSPTTKDDDLNIKVPKYLESGISEIWIVDPAENMLKIIESNSIIREFRSDEWAESKIIKGFKILPEWLWKAKNNETINVLEKFKEIL